MSTLWRALGTAAYLTLRLLFTIARAVAGVDRALREGVGGAVTALARAFFEAIGNRTAARRRT